MQKQYRLAMRADLGHAAAKHTGALAGKSVARCEDIVHLETKMMDTALRIAPSAVR
jgi:hypothetical protein